MKKSYPYLKDVEFLNKIYTQHNRTSYCNIISLSWDEKPLQEIQGKIISASISCNGDSTIRRTANLSIKIQDDSELYNNIDSLFNINKKIFLETGLSNGLRHLGAENYPNYPIIWFPFGVFVITNHSVSHDASGITVNLNLSDKMSLLNGDAGGVIPASVNFESVDTLGPDGDLHTELLRINQIIPEMLNHFGGEDLNRIIVNDIPNQIKQVLKWKSSAPLYLWVDKTNPANCYYTQSELQNNANYYSKMILYGYDAGYTYVDFTYPGELTANAGDSVCTILDKIKTTLGNFEYYYDVFGNFVFQEIKNYINTTEWRTLVQEQKYGNNDIYLPYTVNPTLHSKVYSFTNSDLVISYNNSPQFNMIKNDFVVWGERKTDTGLSLPCRYHLAIDKRPKLTSNWVIAPPHGLCFDTNIQDKTRRCFLITDSYNSVQALQSQLPVGIVGKYYYVNVPNNAAETGVYTWVTDKLAYQSAYQNMNSVSPTTVYTASATPEPGYVKLPTATYYPSWTLTPDTNWRNILYFQGLMNSFMSLDAGYYWAELCNEWPKIYDIEKDGRNVNNQYPYAGNAWITEKTNCPTSLDWWLDIIDNDSVLNNFAVDVIGRRSYAKVESGCNCVFEPDIPDIVMVNIKETSQDKDYRTQKTWNQLRELGLYPSQVSQPIYDSLMIGGTFNSCYQNVRQLITDYTNYNENISVTCLPIYHLEPNTRVSFNDPESGIYGDYIINTISFNLGNNSTMSISAKKCVEKI